MQLCTEGSFSKLNIWYLSISRAGTSQGKPLVTGRDITPNKPKMDVDQIRWNKNETASLPVMEI